MRNRIMKYTFCSLKRGFPTLVTIVVLLNALIPLSLPVAADNSYVTFNSGAVLIDSSYNGKNILIKNGVFSVTVSGATDISILFDNVTIDRRHTTIHPDPLDGKKVENLRAVSEALGWLSGGNYIPPVAPLLVTNNAEVTIAFRGANYFYAGTDWCTVDANSVYHAKKIGGGFAGIQVDPGSTLTIAPNQGSISAYGALMDTATDTSYKSDTPPDVVKNRASGGAGIGGGAYFSIDDDQYPSIGPTNGAVSGAAGTIIINGGNIYAQGGHQAAGIGGGFNAPATRSSITINGGNVVARGGQWATGIGDGDSNNHRVGGVSDYFDDDHNRYSINIHGGNVTAIGGTACPGIGCTDEVTQYTGTDNKIVELGRTSGLQIVIDGGVVNARSGYPADYTAEGNYTGTDAPAAIGAGSRSNMESNSITIGSGANVIASGFGYYAITENGVVYDALPTVNIDSDSYMFLGRFPQLTSAENRTFHLLNAQQINIGGHTYIKYCTQPKNGTAGTVYYYNTETTPALLNAQQKEVTNEDGTPLTPAQLSTLLSELNLTLYVDETSDEISQVTALAHFRSIAMTLPNPEEHGGIYALRIPTDALQGYNNPDYTLPLCGYAITTIGAHGQSQGVISGELAYPWHGNVMHDVVSEPFTDLDVYMGNSHTDGTNGLIGDFFAEESFAYQVNIEPEVNSVYIYARFADEEDINYELLLNNSPIGYETDENEGYITPEIDMTGLSEKIIRIKKTDTLNGDISGSIIYKITITRKSTYTINFSSPNKIYDGQSVTPIVSGIYDASGNVVSATDAELSDITYRYFISEDGSDTWSYLGVNPPKHAGIYKVTANISAKTYNATGEVQFEIDRCPLTVTHIGNYLAYVTTEEFADWTAPHEILSPGQLFLSGIVGGDTVEANANQVYYNDITIGYGAQKITVDGITISGINALDYSIASTQMVFGQISFSLDGTLFRKKADSTSPWHKFYPIDSETPVGDDTADYHSPKNGDAYNAHSEYVMARTVGEGENRSVYAVDIEFGAMYFTYSVSVWDPESLNYIESKEESQWFGLDGTNNKIEIVNYSNVEIGYSATCKIDFLHSAVGDSNIGLRAGIYEENTSSGPPITGIHQTVPAAYPGTPYRFGFAGRASCYLLISGVPQIDASSTYTAVGSITLALFRISS